MIVFENENFIAADKPHGWLTTPAREALDPRPCLGRDLQSQAGQQIYPVHRLDFEVSGLVLFAKNPPAHTAAQKWFEDLKIGKMYEAYSRGGATREVPSAWQEWKSTLVRGKRRAFEAAHGKPAVTRARVIGEVSWKSIQLLSWELIPRTGRSHQLRFEMAKHGAPILGDTLYGGEAGPKDWLALRARSLNFAQIPERFGLPENLSVSGLVLP